LSLNKEDPDITSALKKCPVCKLKRIAMATKIYYFSNPLKWTIYDSRVGFALLSLIAEYAKEKEIPTKDVFPNGKFCLPPSQHSSKTSGRKSVFGNCHTEGKSLWSFIWTSHLHRMIARKLNSTEIEKPDHFLSNQQCWELPHIEMVFFMLGDSQWVDVNENAKGRILTS
jgi:hypothetical protein